MSVHFVGNRTFIFVVDTDTYAGNFERPLTAYCTGQIGECNVGEERAEEFERECPELGSTFEDLVAQVPDDHGCHRPTSIWTTPGYWNDGMGNEWPDADWGKPETIEKYRHALRDYKTKYPNSFRDKDIETAMPGRHPAFLSVAIFLNEEPSKEVLGFLMERAKKYVPGEYEGSFKVTGFRLLQQVLTENTLWTSNP